MEDLSTYEFFSGFTNEEVYRQIVENTFETTIIHSDYKVLYINETGARALKAKKEDLIGEDVLSIFPDCSKGKIFERVRKALEEDEIGELIEETIIASDGSYLEIELYCHPFKIGEKPAILSVFRDISVKKAVERQLKQRVNEVSTPIVPVLDGISIIPLVGTIDSDKAQILLDTLPAKLKLEEDTKHIIIDFSGIYNLDEIAIDFLVKINSIMRLLGISPILTGIRPELAQIAIKFGEDLHSLKTMSSVKQALLSLKQ